MTLSQNAFTSTGNHFSVAGVLLNNKTQQREVCEHFGFDSNVPPLSEILNRFLKVLNHQIDITWNKNT